MQKMSLKYALCVHSSCVHSTLCMLYTRCRARRAAGEGLRERTRVSVVNYFPRLSAPTASARAFRIHIRTRKARARALNFVNSNIKYCYATLRGTHTYNIFVSLKCVFVCVCVTRCVHAKFIVFLLLYYGPACLAVFFLFLPFFFTPAARARVSICAHLHGAHANGKIIVHTCRLALSLRRTRNESPLTRMLSFLETYMYGYVRDFL